MCNHYAPFLLKTLNFRKQKRQKYGKTRVTNQYYRVGGNKVHRGNNQAKGYSTEEANRATAVAV